MSEHQQGHVRRNLAYTTTFRRFSAAERRVELAALRHLYTTEALSIRRIAERKNATYGFIRARLIEAGVDVSVNRKDTFAWPALPSSQARRSAAVLERPAAETAASAERR